MRRTILILLLGLVLAGVTARAGGGRQAAVTLLNVSYDPTREFYQEVNTAFNRSRAARGLPEVAIRQSHGGSGKQAR